MILNQVIYKNTRMDIFLEKFKKNNYIRDNIVIDYNNKVVIKKKYINAKEKTVGIYIIGNENHKFYL